MNATLGFWLFMLAMCLLLPAFMLGFGWLFRKHPPQKINYLYGYRTKMAMKNEDTWLFAQKAFGKSFWRLGCFLTPLSAAAMLPVCGRENGVVGTWGGFLCMVQCILLFLPIWQTERALREAFDRDGNRKPAA